MGEPAPLLRMRRLILPLLLTVSALPSHGLEIIAHRGASKDAPENTVASFRLAWKQKADASELDVYLSRDGQAVVLHDPTTKRTTGLDKKVSEQTLAELRGLDAGRWKGPQWKGEKIPTVAEALETMPDGKRFFVEIKCGPEVLPVLQQVFKDSGKKASQLVLIGFSYPIVEKAKALMPDIAVYWLVAPQKNSDGRKPTASELVEKAKAAKLDGVFVQSTFAIDTVFAATIQAAGLRLTVWTVNDPLRAKQLAAVGVDGIGTDAPELLRQALAQP